MFDPVFGIDVQWPEMSTKDTTKYAAAFQQVVVGCGLALDRGLLSKETALMIMDSVAARLGVAFDADAELAKASEQAAKEAESDAYPGPVIPANVPGEVSA